MREPARINTRAELAAALGDLRERSGKSYLELATQSGLGNATVHDLVRGKTFPRWNSLELVLQACGETDLEAWHEAYTRAKYGNPKQTIETWNPIDLGIHKAIDPSIADATERLPLLPPYIERQHDLELRSTIDGIESAIMVVLVGESSTGKTRSAYEAIKYVVPNWGLVHPADSAELVEMIDSSVPDNTVIWLNETQIYFNSSRGADAAAALQRLLVEHRNHPILIIGSMWIKSWFQFSEGRLGELGTNDHTKILSELRRFHTIHVPNDFKTTDVQKWVELHPAALHDPRLQHAVEAAGESRKITQALAGGPLLIDRYRNDMKAFSRAAITASVEATRLGYHGPLPVGLLRDAIPGYLTETERVGSEDWFATALTDAAKEVMGIRALTPIRKQLGVGDPDSYVLHDYLYQYYTSFIESETFPGSLWDSLAAHAADIDNLSRITWSAWQRGRRDKAMIFAEMAAELGEPRFARQLSALRTKYEQVGNLASPLTWANYVHDQARDQPPSQQRKRPANHHFDESDEKSYRHPESEQEKLESLEPRLWMPVHAILTTGGDDSIVWPLDLSSYSKGEIAQMIDDPAYTARILVKLGYSLMIGGRHQEAEAAYKRAMDIDSDYALSYNNLGWLNLNLRGDHVAAEPQFLRAIQIDGNKSAYRQNLGWLYVTISDYQKAVQHLEIALSMDMRRVLRAEILLWAIQRTAADIFHLPDSRRSEAENEEMLRKAVGAGRQQVYANTYVPEFLQAEHLSLTLAILGKTQEAEKVFAAAIGMRTAGDLFAKPLYDLLLRAGARIEKMLHAWREIIDADRDAVGPWGPPH